VSSIAAALRIALRSDVMSQPLTRGRAARLGFDARSLEPYHGADAGVAELADAQDLKSWVPKGACGFDTRPRHCLLAILTIAPF
jgi:hypothetical protein